jgi:hypothetical protein
VAEQLGVAQKRITERLQILDLPEELHPKLAAGEIPPAGVKPLVQLARLPPRCRPWRWRRSSATSTPNGWEEPISSRDVAADPLAVVAQPVAGELPPDVYQAWGQYPLDRFSLTDKARKDLDKLARLGHEVSHVGFCREVHEQAQALVALHGSLIVGQDVADQLACDRVAWALKEARRPPQRRPRDRGGRLRQRRGRKLGTGNADAAQCTEVVCR